MTISKNKGIFSSPVLDGKEYSPSPFWCSKKPFARLVFLCYFEGTVPSGVQTPAPLKMIAECFLINGGAGSIRSANSGSIEELCKKLEKADAEFHPECKLRLH